MDAIEVFHRDRATRSFTDEPVARDELTTILEAGRRAGSGKNRQPWSFVVVHEPDRLDALAATGTYTSPLAAAPVGIVLLVEHRSSGGYTETDVFDCGRAFQNCKLAATALGLGAVPLYLDPDTAGAILEVPGTKTVLIALAVGHPAAPVETIEGRPKADVLERSDRRPLEALVHWGTHR